MRGPDLCDGDGDGFLVDVQVDVMYEFAHAFGCLVSLFNEQRPCFRRCGWPGGSVRFGG
jgi:hypothetical protein